MRSPLAAGVAGWAAVGVIVPCVWTMIAVARVTRRPSLLLAPALLLAWLLFSR